MSAKVKTGQQSLIWLFDLLNRGGGGYGGSDRRDRGYDRDSRGGDYGGDRERDRSKLDFTHFPELFVIIFILGYNRRDDY